GVLLEEEDFSKIKEIETKDLVPFFTEALKKQEYENISIIDGMQRSNVYKHNLYGNENREIRVEYWIASSISNLLYRMLVLNTGQVPWNVRRQIEVVYKPLLNRA